MVDQSAAIADVAQRHRAIAIDSSGCSCCKLQRRRVGRLTCEVMQKFLIREEFRQSIRNAFGLRQLPNYPKKLKYPGGVNLRTMTGGFQTVRLRLRQ